MKPYADKFREVLEEIDYIDEVDKIVSFITGLKERVRKEVSLAQLSRDRMGMPMNFDEIEVYALQVGQMPLIDLCRIRDQDLLPQAQFLQMVQLSWKA